MPVVLSEFQETLENFHHALGDFLITCDRIRPEDRSRSGVCGIWSPREVVAHLAGWMWEGAQRYRVMLEQPGDRKEYDDDVFNAQSVAARADWSWERTLSDFKAAYRDLEEAVSEVMVANPPDWRPFRSWLRGIGRDLVLHNNQLKEWL